MALVRVKWSETIEYVREIEVDGFSGENEELEETLLELLDRTEGAEQIDGTVLTIEHHEVVRAGDLTPTITAAKPSYVEDF